MLQYQQIKTFFSKSKKRKINTRTLDRSTGMWNVKVTVISVIIDTLVTVLNNSEKHLDEIGIIKDTKRLKRQILR